MIHAAAQGYAWIVVLLQLGAILTSKACATTKGHSKAIQLSIVCATAQGHVNLKCCAAVKGHVWTHGPDADRDHFVAHGPCYHLRQ